MEKQGIIDLQRFPVSNGRFTVYLEIKDINDTNNTERYQEEFSIVDSNEPFFSDLELLDSYWKEAEGENNKSELTKSGYHMIPLVTDYFGDEFEKLADKLYFLTKTLKEFSRENNSSIKSILEDKIEQIKLDFDARNQKTID